MDNRNFINRLATRTNLNNKEASRLAQALISVLAESNAQDENVALPGFGVFEADKTLEYVATDASTGKRLLFPPSIKCIFKSGSRLKKAVSKK